MADRYEIQLEVTDNSLEHFSYKATKADAIQSARRLAKTGMTDVVRVHVYSLKTELCVATFDATR